MLKGAIRSKQLSMSRNRMMAEVATADVVLVNPTHVAVALRYEPGSGAPKVVAKGAGAVAARIRAEADRAPRPAGRGRPAGPRPARRVRAGPGGPRPPVHRRRPRARVRHGPAPARRGRRPAPRPRRLQRSRPTTPPTTGPRPARAAGPPGPARPPRSVREAGNPMKNRSVAQMAVPVGVVGIVLLLVVPLPAAAARRAHRGQHHRVPGHPAHQHVRASGRWTSRCSRR